MDYLLIYNNIYDFVNSYKICPSYIFKIIIKIWVLYILVVLTFKMMFIRLHYFVRISFSFYNHIKTHIWPVRVTG